MKAKIATVFAAAMAAGCAHDDGASDRLEPREIVVLETDHGDAFSTQRVLVEDVERIVVRYPSESETVLVTDPRTGESVLALDVDGAETFLVPDDAGEFRERDRVEVDPIAVAVFDACVEGALGEIPSFRQARSSLHECEYKCEVTYWMGVIQGYSFDLSGCYAGCAYCSCGE